MEYTIHKLAQLSGISTRALRYYDQIGLLAPARIASNGYRIYGQAEVNRLQQILFYRELGVALEEISRILSDPNYDESRMLEGHLSALLLKKAQIESLIQNVTKTIASRKGAAKMSDKEKFEGFKQNMIDKNEDSYGKEIRGKYGDDAVDSSHAKIKGMSEEQMNRAEALRASYESLLKAAFERGDPAHEEAQKACDLHRQWLTLFWKDGAYSKEAHRALAQMYVSDERFTAYYDGIAKGCAPFFYEAIEIYCR